jgi:hypothetical protein
MWQLSYWADWNIYHESSTQLRREQGRRIARSVGEDLVETDGHEQLPVNRRRP